MSGPSEMARIIWETSRRDEQSISAMGADIVADALRAAGYRKVEVVKEWGARFDANGNVYNLHRTLEEAQRFVDAMNEVDAGMSVVVREHTPGIWTAWQPVA